MALRTVTPEDDAPAAEERSIRYTLLPAWILVPQMFLAAGWLRAGVGHTMRTEWWSGQDLQDFAADQADHSILGYNRFLENVVADMPFAIAVVVAAAQVLVGLALLANLAPVRALTVGAFLNVNFMLAGVVNPSVFYLVLAGGIVSWHLDRNLSSEAKGRLVKRSLLVAAVGIAVVVFEVGSVHPKNVTEDPASVLIFLLLLTVLTAWSIRDLDGVDESEAIADTQLSAEEH
ncbi:MAG: hypothetical protein AAGA65_08650 [Actinomycetota bacterium]